MRKHKFMKHKYMKPKEAADYLRISLSTFYNYSCRGKIPYRVLTTTGAKLYVKKDLDGLFVKGEDIKLEGV